MRTVLKFGPFSTLAPIGSKRFGRNVDFAGFERNTGGTKVLNIRKIRPLRPFSAYYNEAFRYTIPISLI